MAQPDPTYDLQSALDTLMPGVVLQRSLLDAAAARYQAKGFVRLTQSDVTTILAATNTLDQGGASYVPTTVTPYPGALPLLPAGLKRFADSNPAPSDGWSIDQGASVGGVSDV